MDFLDPHKKRAHNKRIFLGYFLIGIGIILSALILVFISYGYKYDGKSGEIVQNGLIFVDSNPESSTIFLNNKENGKTEERLTVPEGKYDIELRKTGYTTWKKSINLTGSSIESLIYPKLIPNKLESSESKIYTHNPEFSTQSLDRKWILVSLPGTINSFDLYDTSKPKDPPVGVQFPKTLFTDPVDPKTNKIELLEWSSDNKHFLIKHYYDDKNEFLILNREVPETSQNLNTFFAVAPISIQLRDKKADQFYIHKTDLTVYSAKTNSKDLAPVLTNVNSFKPHQKDLIIYATNDPVQSDKTIVKLQNKDKSYLIGTYDKSEMLVDIVKFDGSWYAAVNAKASGKLYVYKDPMQKLDAQPKVALTPHLILRLENPIKLSFSNNARFLLTQNSEKLAIYDFEDNDRYSYKLDKKLEPGQYATWMDGHRLLVKQDNNLKLFEFDNNNKRTLVPINLSSDGYFDRDYLRLFTLSPSKTDPNVSTMYKTILKVGLKD